MTLLFAHRIKILQEQPENIRKDKDLFDARTCTCIVEHHGGSHVIFATLLIHAPAHE